MSRLRVCCRLLGAALVAFSCSTLAEAASITEPLQQSCATGADEQKSDVSLIQQTASRGLNYVSKLRADMAVPSATNAWCLLVQWNFESQEQANKALELFGKFAEYVKKNEPTTLSYEALVSDKVPTQLLIFERYVDKENALLKIHKGTDEFRVFRSSLDTLQPTIDGHSYYESGTGHFGRPDKVDSEIPDVAVSKLPSTTKAWCLPVKLIFESEDQVTKALKLYEGYAAHVTRDEPATLAYEVLVSDKVPTQLLVFERYANKEDAYMRVHKGSAEQQVFRPALDALQPKVDGHSYYESGLGFMERR